MAQNTIRPHFAAFEVITAVSSTAFIFTLQRFGQVMSVGRVAARIAEETVLKVTNAALQYSASSTRSLVSISSLISLTFCV